MSIPTHYCRKCETNLCRLGIDYLDIFRNICEQYLEDREPLEVSDEFLQSEARFLSVLQSLEKNGYLISTETDLDLIQIKPLGIHCAHINIPQTFPNQHADDVVCYICLKDGRH